MILVDDLPIKNWAKTLAFDFDIVDELANLNITAVFPKDTTKFWPAWRIEKITVYRSAPRQKTAITFCCNARIKGKVYTQNIRIYSPHAPRIKDLNEYLGRRVVGANFICAIRTSKQLTLVARFIQTVSKKGRKSNPIMRSEDDARNISDKQQSYQIDSLIDYGPMNEKCLLETYFPKRDPNKFLIKD